MFRIWKRNGTEVIGWPQVSDFDGRFGVDDAGDSRGGGSGRSGGRCGGRGRRGGRRRAALLKHHGLAFDDYVEVVARLALLHDRFAVVEGARLQRVGHCVTLPFLQTLCNAIKKKYLISSELHSLWTLFSAYFRHSRCNEHPEVFAIGRTDCMYRIHLCIRPFSACFYYTTIAY